MASNSTSFENGLSHPMLSICSHGNDEQTDVIEIEVCVTRVFVDMNSIEHVSSFEEVFPYISFHECKPETTSKKMVI